MNRFLRTAPTRRLAAVMLGIVAAVVGGTAIAIAASGSGPVPPPASLAQAIRGALAARPVPGIAATVSFTDNLISPSNIQGSDPLLNGTPSGRLWASAGGRLRLELQGDNGDAQVVLDKTSWWISDPTSKTVYEGMLPAGEGAGKKTSGAAGRLPTVAAIQAQLNRLMGYLTISGAIPGDIAGQPTYTVTVSPKQHGGLLGSVQLAWDALHGVPLKFAVYARGDTSPVLALTVTGVSYGPVPSSVFDISPPSGYTPVRVSLPAGLAGAGQQTGGRQKRHPAVTGLAAVAKRVPFTLDAPARLAGMGRQLVTLLHLAGHPAALIVYGHGLGAIVVIEQVAHGTAAPGGGGATGSGGEQGQGLTIPTVKVHGASARQLATALGTVVSFSRAGVSYTVLGSVTAATADRAARGL